MVHWMHQYSSSIGILCKVDQNICRFEKRQRFQLQTICMYIYRYNFKNKDGKGKGKGKGKKNKFVTVTQGITGGESMAPANLFEKIFGLGRKGHSGDSTIKS